MQQLVSIIIPVYNAIPYLEECLASVAGQTYQNIEVIVINDGSTDHSGKQIEEFAASDKRFNLYTQENHGLGYTRNRGISLCTGKYIFFLDADDTIPEKAIQQLIAEAEKNDADYVVGKVVRFNEERKYIPVRHVEFNLYSKSMLTSLAETPELIQDSIACNKLWKKSLLVDHDLSFKEGKYYEDLTLTMKAAVLAKKIKVIDKVVYNWRIREHENNPSITQQQMKLENTLDRLDALEKNKKWLLDSNIADRLIEEHDLKSLLDIVRLHVIKFALIDESEREEWRAAVVSFLRGIPSKIAEKLPEKEKTLYSLLMGNKVEDLLLFSTLFTDTETQALATQEEKQFTLKGHYQIYDITPYIKPVLAITNIELSKDTWELTGNLKVPKAGNPVEGLFYAKAREGGQEISFTPLLTAKEESRSCYACEEQKFNILIDSSHFLEFKQDAVFDFYFRLKTYETSQTTRVRLNAALIQEKKYMKLARGNLFFYRTNYGNLSMELQKSTLKKYVAQKLRPFIKK